MLVHVGLIRRQLNPMKTEIFVEGQQVVYRSREVSPLLALGETYTVVEFSSEEGGLYPALVVVRTKQGKTIRAHAHRFTSPENYAEEKAAWFARSVLPRKSN